ncbi:hypothetical protein jhhlp_008569 [Lomentospora prolificans]|uniref:Major facilitator superfamily (MFS) profile domain-containing protein n=1 Tax=Lomentospora prolificans TaxID=41688 RepID=A0A2N3MYF0_9PEZI|nr:hypothetical protein jhhlp_008569 [Lomentospora prolificans]
MNLVLLTRTQQYSLIHGDFHLSRTCSGTYKRFRLTWTEQVDAYPNYAASALAANQFMRCVFAAVFPLFGNQMYNTLGYQWAGPILAFLTVVMLPFPYIFFKFGKTIRGNSRFAPA